MNTGRLHGLQEGGSSATKAGSISLATLEARHGQLKQHSYATTAAVLLLSLALLVSPGLTQAQQVAQSTSAPSRIASTETISGELATTDIRGDGGATTLAAIASETSRATAAAASSGEPTTATDEEPATSTVDALAVNSDEESAPETPEEGAGGALEAKSISRLSADNTLAPSSAEEPENGDEEKAKLTIEASAPSVAAASGAPKTPALNQLNMTQVDQMYTEARKGEREIVASWQSMAKKLKKGISGMVGAAVPMALNMTQEAKISTNCSGAMLKWVLSMTQLKSWAMRMLDASGKPIAGLLEGSMTLFGNYRQCLRIRAPDEDEIEFTGTFKEYFRGKYCIIQAKPWLPKKARFYSLNAKLDALTRSEDEDSGDQPAAAAAPGETKPEYERTVMDELGEWALAFNYVNIRFDLCVPSLCRREDIQKTVNFMLKGLDIKARVLRCETEAAESSFSAAVDVETGSPDIAEALAATSTVKVSGHLAALGLESPSNQLCWLLVPAIAIVLVLIATTISMTIERRAGKTLTQDIKANASKSKLGRTIQSLSLKRSVDSHMNVDYEQLADDKPLALYGVRFVLVMWVLLVESAVNLKFEYLRELLVLKDLIFWWPLQIIINSTLQFDSLILLTAFTMAYKNCLNDGVNNAKAITRFVLDKYVRLMPSVMVMVALVILTPLTYRGPVWNDYVTSQSAICQSTGWINSLFLQNYLPYNQICLPQTWLLCVEFQLVLLIAPLVYYLNKSYTANYGNNQGNVLSNGSTKKVNPSLPTSRKYDSSKMFYWLWTTPGVILVLSIMFSLCASFYNVYSKDLPPTWFYTMADPDSKAVYFGEHMTKLWTHLAVFAIGILAGVECRRAAKNVIRCYKGSNIDYITHVNSLSRQHKSQSSSASSLPVILAQNDTIGSGNSFSSSAKSTSDNNNNWQSSISISMGNNTTINGSNEQLNVGNCGNGNGDHSLGIKSGFHQYNEIKNISANDQHKSPGGRGLCAILLDIFISLIAITTMSVIIFSTHDWSLNDLPKPFVAGLFDAGSRFLWSLAMIWLLYMISVPNKDRSFSLLARSLGHPFMVCLGKLSFLIYIIHPFVHTAVLAIQEQPIYSNWLMLFHILIGNITITVILASLVSLFVEMPCRNLFRRCGASILLTQSDIIPSGQGITRANTTAAAATNPSSTATPAST